MPASSSFFTFKVFKCKNPRMTLYFFPAGFTKLSSYRLTLWQLKRMNIDVVGFDFDWRNATKNMDKNGSAKLFHAVDEVVSSYIKSSPGTTYAVFGTSFGGALAIYCAKKHLEITRLILCVPHATMSKVLWTYKPTKAYKERLIIDGINSEAKLNKHLGDLEPQHNIRLLKNKKIVNFTALNDQIVTNGLELSTALKNVNSDVTLHQTRYGHFIGGTLGILRKNDWKHVLIDYRS